MNPQEHENRRAYLKEKAHAWQARYDEALDRVLGTPASTREDFLDVIWNHGILNRIAPTDPEERTAREELRSDLWKGTREDQELYLRLMYSAGSQEEAIRRNLSAAGGGLTGGVSWALGALMRRSDRTLWDRFMGNDPNGLILIASVKERAAKELRARGGVPHEPIIPWGAEGNYKGIPVVIE